MKIRDLQIFIGALIISIIVAFVARWILSANSNAGPKAADLTSPVLVASVEMPTGTKLNRQMVEWREWPKSAITEDYITQDKPQLYTKAISSAARELITRNEPIRLGSLAQPGEHGLLASLITPGMRAFTINLAQGGSVPTLIVPDDYVDITVASRKADNSTAYRSETVVQKVKVIAVDSSLDESSQRKDNTPPKSITVEVTPEEAEKLTAVLKDNTVSVTLYSTSDYNSKKGEKAPDAPEPKETVSTVKIIRRNDVTSTTVKN